MSTAPRQIAPCLGQPPRLARPLPRRRSLRRERPAGGTNPLRDDRGREAATQPLRRNAGRLRLPRRVRVGVRSADHHLALDRGCAVRSDDAVAVMDLPPFRPDNIAATEQYFVAESSMARRTAASSTAGP